MPYLVLFPSAIMIFSIIIGISIEKLLSTKLIKMAEKSRFTLDDIVVGAFKGMIILWFFLGGAYMSLLWIFGKQSWMSQVIKVFICILIISVTVVTVRIATGLVNTFSRNAEGILPSTSIFANLTKLLVFVIGILIMLQYLGISITPILTTLGVGGLAVALALQDTIFPIRTIHLKHGGEL